MIIDLARTIVRSHNSVFVDRLLDELARDERLADVSREELEDTLRCCVASKTFEVVVDKKRKPQVPALRLTGAAAEAEKTRAFAGTFASELSHLSERIRLLVQHPTSVGTYRETLLQTLLRRNLPERYHVGTGFIYGCQRQVDILIYDRVDYAPLFREGDLVVVPPQAVRAAIEVKQLFPLMSCIQALH